MVCASIIDVCVSRNMHVGPSNKNGRVTLLSRKFGQWQLLLLQHL